MIALNPFIANQRNINREFVRNDATVSMRPMISVSVPPIDISKPMSHLWKCPITLRTPDSLLGFPSQVSIYSSRTLSCELDEADDGTSPISSTIQVSFHACSKREQVSSGPFMDFLVMVYCV